MIYILLLLLIVVYMFMRWLAGADSAALASAVKIVLWTAFIVLMFMLILTGRAVSPIFILLMVFAGVAIRKYLKKPSGDSDHMTRAEALKILDLGDSPTKAQIMDAHKRLMKKVHPDTGGSVYLAQKLNAARDMLIRDKNE
ncbi:MAG: hypothetical protein KBB83_00680 [Alphaproteobacteria bacterium]|nr:hypothetical protein [Alphaproteobacteria bacterium]